MPIFTYHCRHCQCAETRVGGVDDHLASCARCGQKMRRQSDLNTVFIAYG